MIAARRTLLLGSLALVSGAAASRPIIRVGALKFGSVDWELDVIHAHALAQGIKIEVVPLAATPAAQVALQGGRVDVIVQDWLWVSRQRASGADWTLSPTSGAVGAIVTPAASPIRTVANLAGRRLGVAGSPLDKSWLILRAYAQRVLGFDLATRAEPQFGAPPLLAAELAAGRLDATLTYWPYAARAEAAGMRSVLTVEQAVRALGVAPGLPFVGYVFSAAWANANRAALTAFLDAGRRARDILAHDDAEWQRLRKLTGATDDAELVRLRAWYRGGVPGPLTPAQLGDAARTLRYPGHDRRPRAGRPGAASGAGHVLERVGQVHAIGFDPLPSWPGLTGHPPAPRRGPWTPGSSPGMTGGGTAR